MEQTVLKTDSTSKLLKELDIYTLVADWTHREDALEVQEKLDEYGIRNIPLLAIYPKNVDKPVADKAKKPAPTGSGTTTNIRPINSAKTASTP